MRLGYGIFLGYFLVALLAAYFVLNVFVDEIKPSARQAMEDSLVDSANLLAELAADELKAGTLAKGQFQERVSAYQARRLDASIWGFKRQSADFRIYITDVKGIVLYDSRNESLGQDYSKWNDVYLTLKGRYGVRSSPDSRDGGSTTMYVAAPIRSNGEIIGSLTVGKSNLAVQPFIERTQEKIIRAGYGLLAASLLIGILISFWLSTALGKLVAYAEAVSRGERAVLPSLSLVEIRKLGDSLQLMREKLEGKNYIEEYTLTLTHEMKSPLTAIQAATELLHEPMPAEQRRKFLDSIRDQSRRLHVLVEKMLDQARLENRRSLEKLERLDLVAIIRRALAAVEPRIKHKDIMLQCKLPDHVESKGDSFLLEQSILNLLDNAVDFSPEHSSVEVELSKCDSQWKLSIKDHGPGIPDYARDKIFDRYYSLPRPAGGSKSTGLGLPFVRQVMILHDGLVEVANHNAGGVEASLFIPT